MTAGLTASGLSADYARQMGRGILSGASTVVIMRIAALVTVPLLLHILGLQLYGAWAVAAILVSGQGLVDLGMATSTVKYAADAHARDDRAAALRVIVVSLLLYTLLAAIVAAALFPVIGGVPGAIGVPRAQQADARILLIGALALFALSNYTNVASALLQGFQRVSEANLALVASQIVYVGGLVLTWQEQWGSLGVVSVIGGMYLVQTVLMVFPILRRMPRGRSTAPRTTLREYIGYGSKLQIGVVVDFVVLQAPKLVAAGALGAAAAARVDIAMRLPIAATALALPLLPPLIPAAARLVALGDTPALTALYLRATRHLTTFAVPAGTIVVVFGPALLIAWLGSVASGLDLAVRLFGVAFLAHSLCGVATSTASGAGVPALVAKYKLVLLAVSAVALAAFAAAGRSIDSVAAAVAIGFTVSALYMFWRMDSVVGRPGRREAADVTVRSLIAASLGGCAGAACFALMAPLPEAVGIVAGLIVLLVAYAAVGVPLGVLRPREIRDDLRRSLTRAPAGVQRGVE